jgi:hypothetical protein
MESAVIKWRRIATEVMREGVSPQVCDDTVCMTKWNVLYGEFKKIKDYHSASGQNVSYFALTAEERDKYGLPRNFIESHFEQMHDFLQERPAIQPPHCRDFQRRVDEDPVYDTASEGVEGADDLDLYNADVEYCNFDNVNLPHKEEKEHGEPSPCNIPEHGPELGTSTDFMNMSDRPQLQRRLQTAKLVQGQRQAMSGASVLRPHGLTSLPPVQERRGRPPLVLD